MNGDGVLVSPALVTMSGPVPRRGRELERVEVIPDGALAWRGGAITYAGPARDLPGSTLQWSPPRESTGAVIPGFVDCHTHLPFHGWRADEFEARLSGRSYRDVHGEGGGIARSARLLADASDDEVIEFCRNLGEEMLAHGTTTLELKTGYGLSVEAELRQARLARRLGSLLPQTTTVTLLACHAVPQGLTREHWVDQVCQELIPTAVAEGLVDAVDVFVEDIAFTVEDFRLVAAVAHRHGLAVRCHADQLSSSGAAQAAVSVGARNADHLNHVTSEEIEALGRSETAAVVVPVADLVTAERPPPVAELLDAGAVLALATDFNPGTSPCLSMPEAIAVGCSLYRLSPLAAMGAATINPAKALGRDDRVGSLVAGKRADFLVLESEDPSVIPYRPGHNPVAETWIGGERVWSAG